MNSTKWNWEEIHILYQGLNLDTLGYVDHPIHIIRQGYSELSKGWLLK